MPKKTRIRGEGLFHYIYVRGNDRHPIFKCDADYLRYLELLAKYSKRYKIDVLTY